MKVKIPQNRKFKSVWGIEKLLPVMDMILFKGKFVLKYSEWGDDVISTNIKNPTGYDLWRAADELIFRNGPTDHIFVEAFNMKKNNIIYLETGS